MSEAHDAFAEDLGEAAADAALGHGYDALQYVFWVALAIALGSAAVSLTWRDAVGPAGAVLLIAISAMGLLLLVWTLRGAGRRLGVFPERGAAEAAIQPGRGAGWLAALDEPALMSDRGGATVAANAAYLELAQISTDISDFSHAPSVDRLFGANPGMAAPIYRLSRAVKLGARRTEILPAMIMGDSHSAVQFEASVSPLGTSRALWRLRRLDAAASAIGSVDSRALYVEDAPVGFFSARRDGRVVYVNSLLRQTLGLANEPAGLRLEDILRPEGLRLMRREVRGAVSQRAEVVLRARDGVEMPATLMTVWSGKGPEALSRSIVHLHQSTEAAVRNATSIQAAAARIAGPTMARPDDPVFTDAPFGVARLEGDSVETAVVLDSNRALIDMTGGRAQPGARFADLFASDQGAGNLGQLLAKALDGAVDLKLAGEEQRSADVFVTLTNGRPAAAYIIDMTDKKQLEMRLAQGEKMQTIGQLAGGLAHDFNNLLQGIILNVNKLQVRHPPGDPTFFELKSINEFASRGAELVRMLLAYSRKQVFRQDVFDVSDVLVDYYVLLRDILDERIKLDLVHGRDLPRVRADKRQLETALTNLCTNARDSMIEKNGGGHLTIRTSRADAAAARRDGFTHAKEGDYLLLEVIDDGAGIPPEIMEKIFQPFFTTKEPGAGTGLGLATVYGIVKQSGGYIYPVSRMGKGTTFKIFLPAWTGEDDASNPEPIEPPSRSPKEPQDLAGRGLIVFVEDEEGVRGLAAQLLASCGYSVIEAGDGEKALEIIREKAGQIDMLISDVVMPGMDGPALLRAAKPYLGAARVMFISGYAERDLARTLEAERELSFLPKPFTLRQLAERVKLELQQLERDR